MKKIIKSRAFLVKLIATILGFICVPLLAMQIFVINQSTDEFNRTNEDHYLTLLQGSAQNFASREQLLSDTAWRMSRNDDIQKPLRLSDDEYPLKDMEAANAIDGYSEATLHVEAAGVFYPSEGYLLTGGFKYKLQDYCAKIESAEQSEEQIDPNVPTWVGSEYAKQLEEFFLNLNHFSYYASSDGNTLIAARPISLGVVGRNEAIAFFVMDSKALEESYRATISCRSSIAVLDDKGNYLLKGEDFTENISGDALARFVESGSSSGSVGGASDLVLYRYTDPTSDFVFLLSADRDASQENLLDFARTVRVTMYVMVVVILFSLLAAVYITYRPIHQLLQKYASSKEQDSVSEFERLNSAFLKLKETEAQQGLLADFILGDLLFGNAVKPELITHYFPKDRFKHFTVLTAICPTLSSAEAKQMEELMEKITGCEVYVTSVPSRPHTVIACLSEKVIDANELYYHCTHVISDFTGSDCPVCMGEVVEDIHDLRRSYRSAVIVNLDPMKAEPGSNAGEFAKKLQPLAQCVYMGDEAEALKNLENIRQFLYTQTVGEGHQRYYGFQLIQAYLNGVNSNQTQLSGQEAELLLSFSSMDHLFKLLSESIHQVCGQVADREHKMDARLQQDMIEYVDTHLAESELCLGNVADYVGASIYAVSRLFKEITGKGFKEYVNDKRLENGHQLLCTTSKSIAEIAIAAGFDNANYFSTVFKAKYGMPPTKYRNERKNKQEV